MFAPLAGDNQTNSLFSWAHFRGGTQAGATAVAGLMAVTPWAEVVTLLATQPFMVFCNGPGGRWDGLDQFSRRRIFHSFLYHRAISSGRDRQANTKIPCRAPDVVRPRFVAGHGYGVHEGQGLDVSASGLRVRAGRPRPAVGFSRMAPPRCCRNRTTGAGSCAYRRPLMAGLGSCWWAQEVLLLSS